MIKAVVFDFDGVFIDTERLKTQSYYAVLADPGGPYATRFDSSEDQYLTEHPVGQGRKDVCEWILHRFEIVAEAQRRAEEILCRYRQQADSPDDSHTRLFCAIRDDYEPKGHWVAWKAIAFDRGILYESMKGKAPPIPETIDFLHVARHAGLLLGLVTRTVREVTLNHLQRIGVQKDAFDAIVCEHDDDVIGLGKDRFYQVVCAKLSVSPASSVAIEDTETGVASACKAGVGFIVAVPTLLTRRQNFLGHGADMAVSSLAVLCSGVLPKWLSAIASVPPDKSTP